MHNWKEVEAILAKLGKLNIRLLRKRCDVLIVFSDRKYLLDEVIPVSAQVEMLEPYKDIFVNPIIIIKTFWYFFWVSIKHVSQKKLNINRLITLIYDEHLRIAISYYDPRVVVSLIHDSSILHRLAESYREAKFFVIQNGWNTVYDLKYDPRFSIDNRNKFKLPYFFCFGQNDRDNYINNGHTAQTFDPVGSLAAAVYRANAPHDLKHKYDVCFISQYQFSHQNSFDEGTFPSDDLKFPLISASDMLVRWLVDLAKSTDLKIAIACRTSYAEEIEYFEKKFQDMDSVTVLPRTPDRFSSYRTIDMSELTLTIESTIGFEALGWGAKVMICNPKKHEFFQIKTSPLWYCDATEISQWKHKFFELLEMSQSDYKATVSTGIEYFMFQGSGKPTNEVIKDKIISTLNDHTLTEVSLSRQETGEPARSQSND